MTEHEKMMKEMAGGVLLGVIGLGMIYVVVHFVAKFW